MTRTTVTLPVDVLAALRVEARRRETSVSDVVRQAVSAHLDLPVEGRRVIPFAGIGHSGASDTAERMEELLAEHVDEVFDDAFGRGR